MTQMRYVTREQEDALLERARTGERQAREAILDSLMDRITYLARHYTRRYAWAAHRIEYDDLVSVGSLLVWEKMEHALRYECPMAYFLTALERAIARYCAQSCSLVRDEPTVPIISLDCPLGGTEDTLYDVIAAPLAETSKQPQDYLPLYQAIDALPEKERLAILQGFQLDAHVLDASPEWNTISPSSKSDYRGRALTTLRQTLAAAYTGYASEYIPPRKAARAYETRQITPSQQQRLDHACAMLQRQGVRPTMRKLAQLAGVGSHTANAYLSQCGLVEHHVGQQQRKLDEAYARLLATGQPFSVKRFRQEARVGTGYATAYLRHKRLSIQEKEIPV